MCCYMFLKQKRDVKKKLNNLTLAADSLKCLDNVGLIIIRKRSHEISFIAK